MHKRWKTRYDCGRAVVTGWITIAAVSSDERAAITKCNLFYSSDDRFAGTRGLVGYAETGHLLDAIRVATIVSRDLSAIKRHASMVNAFDRSRHVSPLPRASPSPLPYPFPE